MGWVADCGAEQDEAAGHVLGLSGVGEGIDCVESQVDAVGFVEGDGGGPLSRAGMLVADDEKMGVRM